MAEKSRTKANVISLAVLCAIIALLVLLAIFIPRQDPPDPIQAQASPLTATTMLASDELGDEGEGNADDAEDPSDDEEEQTDDEEDEEEQTEESELIEESFWESIELGPQAEESGNQSDSSTDDGGSAGDGGGSSDGTTGGSTSDGSSSSPSHSNDPSDMVLVTNLGSYENTGVDESDLIDGELSFYAYLRRSDRQELDPGITMRVFYRAFNSLDNVELYPVADDSVYYLSPMDIGQNTIIVQAYEDGVAIDDYRWEFTIDYQRSGEVGGNQPTIVTSIDDRDGTVVYNSKLNMMVTATTYDGNPIYREDVTVTLYNAYTGISTDVTYITGYTSQEYQLTFDPPMRGNTVDYYVTVTATDNRADGGTASKTIHLIYQYSSPGEVIGQCNVEIDLTTIGGGIDYYWSADIVEGESFAYSLVDTLETNGISVEYNGTMDEGFYIARLGITAKRFYEPRDDLWEWIEKDGLATYDSGAFASLGEYDWTQGSGWLYSINGVFYGQSIASMSIQPGDTVKLYFTLAYGKDAGLTSSTAGRYERYCGIWIDGTYTPSHDDLYSVVVSEPTCTTDGEIGWVCTNCGETVETETVAAYGHDWQVIEESPATATTDGYRIEKCSYCGEERTTTLPATG